MAIDPNTALSVAVSGTSAPSAALTAGQYTVTSTTACWVATGVSGIAAAAHGAGSLYVAANYPTAINVPRAGWVIAVIQDAAAGWLSYALST